ncbi:hypothetical protein B0T24DRAFT_72089 [Lasiosphaeria ovina]|uniref:Uncharacterized protein n=1 Tax=Lasiosphaeria ovina TaxID=92902 RepID=A0AAE0NM27_9PEZI|nr:hypothetical protein B0T24DRAFT_72089 [Lasiosphaeria ovina]
MSGMGSDTVVELIALLVALPPTALIAARCYRRWRQKLASSLRDEERALSLNRNHALRPPHHPPYSSQPRTLSFGRVVMVMDLWLESL